MDKDDGIEIIAESIVKIENVEEEADNNLEKTIWCFTELNGAETLKNTIKEESYDEDELEPPAAVFVDREVKKEETEQEHEDPLSLCGDNLSSAFLGNEESLRSPNTGGGTSSGTQTSGEHTAEQRGGYCSRQFCAGELAASARANPCEESLCATQAAITSILTLKHNMNVVLPFVCNICQKRLSRRKSAIAHIQFHILKDPCKCAKCTDAPTDGKSVAKQEQILSGKGPYECKKCNRHFLLRSNAIQHTLLCKGFLYCPMCKKKFASKAAVAKHLVSHREENLHRCTVCQESFSQRKELISHMLVSHSFSGHCSICEVAVEDRETLDKHMRIHFGKEGYTCSVCQENFRVKSSIAKHMLFHSEKIQHKCSICRKGFIQRKNLLQHRRTHAHNQIIPVGPRQHCSICKKICNTRGHLHRHMRIHKLKIHNKSLTKDKEVARNVSSRTAENLHCCSVCQKNFSESKELILHMQVHTQSHHCSVCEMKFKDHGTLMSHMLTHSGEELYECPICKSSFAAKESFVMHTQVHMAERPFECGICEESFSDRGDLLTHLYVHVGKTKNECVVCQRSFETNGSWNFHLQTHMREKLYECSLCQKRFTDRRTLFEHVWKHVGERKWACSICRKGFKHITGLVKHSLTHSEDEHANALSVSSDSEKLKSFLQKRP